MGYRYLKRPKIGDVIQSPRGDVTVTFVGYPHGECLGVVDSLGRDWPMIRASAGWWITAETESIPNDNGYTCHHCGEEVPNLDSPNLSPWNDVMGYFCDENCHCAAGEEQDERRLAGIYSA